MKAGLDAAQRVAPWRYPVLPSQPTQETQCTPPRLKTMPSRCLTSTPAPSSASCDLLPALPPCAVAWAKNPARLRRCHARPAPGGIRCGVAAGAGCAAGCDSCGIRRHSGALPITRLQTSILEYPPSADPPFHRGGFSPVRRPNLRCVWSLPCAGVWDFAFPSRAGSFQPWLWADCC